MSIWFLSTCLLVCALSLILASNPFMTAVTILMTALLVSSLYALLLSSWLAFLVFLIYVGGMLVMFSYFVALTPNVPSLAPNKKLPILIITTALFMSVMTFKMPAPILPFTSFSVELWYQQANLPLLLALASILLLTMIIVVKITNRSKGPLRAFMSYV